MVKVGLGLLVAWATAQCIYKGGASFLVSKKITEVEMEESDSLSLLALFAAEFHSPYRGPVQLSSYVQEQEPGLMLSSFLRYCSHSVILIDPNATDIYTTSKQKIKYFMFFVTPETTDKLQNTLQVVSSDVKRPTITIWFNKPLSSFHIRSLFDAMFNMSFMPTTIIYRSGAKSITISTFNPFEESNTLDIGERGVVFEVQVTRDNVTQVGKHIQEELKRYRSNLCGADVKCMVYEQMPFVNFYENKVPYGPDISTITELAKIINFTPKYTVVDKNKLGKPVYHYIVEELKSKKIDIGVNEYFVMPKAELMKEASLLRPMTSQTLCFLTGKSPPLNSFLILSTIFAPQVWAATVCVSLLVWVIWSVMQDPVKAMCDMIQSLSSSCNVAVEKLWCRILWGSWLLFTLVMINIINSNMVTRYSNPLYSPQVETISQLYDLNYTLYVTSQTFHNISLGSNALYLGPLVPWQTFLNHLFFNILNQKSAVLSTNQLRDYLSVANPMKNQFWVVPECYGTFTTGFLTRWNLPFKEKFYETIPLFVESGLYKKWLDDLLQFVIQREYYATPVENSKAYGLTNYLVAYHILGYGFTLSFLVFIGEISYSKFTHMFSCKRN